MLSVLSLCTLERQGLSLTVVTLFPYSKIMWSQIWGFFVLSLCFSSSITFSRMLSTIAKTYKLSRMSLYEWKLTSLDQPDANLLACNWGSHVVLLFIAVRWCCICWELERNGKVTLPSKEFRKLPNLLLEPLMERRAIDRCSFQEVVFWVPEIRTSRTLGDSRPSRHLSWARFTLAVQKLTCVGAYRKGVPGCLQSWGLE